MSAITTELAQALRSARTRQGLSQLELAQKLGLTQTTISRAEGGHDVRVSTLLQIARGLDLEPLLAPRNLVPSIELLVGSATGPSAAPYGPGDDQPYVESIDNAMEASPIGLDGRYRDSDGTIRTLRSDMKLGTIRQRHADQVGAIRDTIGSAEAPTSGSYVVKGRPGGPPPDKLDAETDAGEPGRPGPPPRAGDERR